MIHQELIYTGLFFLFILLSGFWLSRTGKPYSMFIQTVHKLIGVGAGVFLVMSVVQRHRATALGRNEIVSIVISVVLFAGLVATGGFLASEKPLPDFVNVIHKILPYLTVVSTGVTVYLLI
jgi:hypothetical protein